MSDNLLNALFACLQQLLCSSNQQQQQQQQQQQTQVQHQQVNHQQAAYPPQQQPSYAHPQTSYAHPQPSYHSPSQQQHATPYGQVAGPYHSQDPNLINQSNEKYMALRAQARTEADQMASCFERSKQAFSSGDKASAHSLSEQGKEHQRKKNQIDQEARDWIYYQNNTDSPPGTIDLHGLYVKEAVDMSEQEIQKAQQRGDQEIRFIVGKGNHSAAHVAKIKPAIEDLMERYNLNAHLDPHNSGVLIVQLQASSGGGRSRGRELGNELEQKNGDCTIM